MPPHEPAPSGSDDSTANVTPTWSTNGSEAQTAVADAPVVTDTTADPAATDATADPPAADAANATVAATASNEPADDGSAFLAELTRAMQATAGAERERVTADIEKRRKAHLARIQTRRTGEVGRMRKLADGDLAAIDAWAAGERERIDRERETRAAALRDDLKTSLAEHGSRVDREVQGVERAIAAHRTEIDAFFAELDRETDPVAIAQHAGRRPAFPTLESIAADPATEAATADATAVASTTKTEAPEQSVAEESVAVDTSATAAAPTDAVETGAGVGVMDKGLSSPNLADSWASWSQAREPSLATETESESEPAAASAGDKTADPAGPEELAVVAVTSSASRNEPGGVLQSIPVSRPMSWLRRGSNSDHANGDS